MNAFQVLRRLQAWKKGRALPRGETLHFPIAANSGALILAFVRMGGESSPWGIAWGKPGGRATIRTVPEPRNREAVAQMVAEFAPVLLEHVFHPDHSDIKLTGANEQRPLRQFWLPNASHVEMLHHLAYTYTFARKGEPKRIEVLNALGRAAGALFREFNRPGQVAVMSACEALRESFVFPCEDVRQGHLGYLLAWLEASGRRAERLAAVSAAERRSMSTLLDPALERTELAERVERYGEAQREGAAAAQAKAEREIAQVLSQELRHRFDLTASAIARLREDQRQCNRGVDELIKSGWKANWYDYMRTERDLLDNPGGRTFIPSPETDTSPSAAAGRYFTQQEAEEVRLSRLLDDDREMQAEALGAGEAIHGTILDVRDEGVGHGKTPIWEVETDSEAPTKLRKNSRVFVARLRSRMGRVRDISIRNGRTIFTIEITSLKTVPRKDAGAVLPATDRRLIRTVVDLLPGTAAGIHALKRKKLSDRGLPGSWLTDSRPTSRRAAVPPEIAGPVDTPDGDGA